MSINFDQLWNHVTPLCHAPWSVHGPDHWRRVERNGLILAPAAGADVEVVRLFALFHDSCRVNDGHDPGHGARGAALAERLRGKLFELSDARFDLLRRACAGHTDERHHADATIGACFDADRLDLGRVGMIPSAAYMSTELGRRIAEFGSVERWLATSGDSARPNIR